MSVTFSKPGSKQVLNNIQGDPKINSHKLLSLSLRNIDQFSILTGTFCGKFVKKEVTKNFITP